MAAYRTWQFDCAGARTLDVDDGIRSDTECEMGTEYDESRSLYRDGIIMGK